MKTTFFLAALLSSATLGYAQTTPTPSAGTAGTSPAAGTKNVGSDRADLPTAPGMQAATTTPIAGARASSTKNASAKGHKKASSSKAGAPMQ